MGIRQLLGRLTRSSTPSPVDIIRTQEPTAAEVELERTMHLSRVRRETVLAAVRSGVTDLDDLVDEIRYNPVEGALLGHREPRKEHA